MPAQFNPESEIQYLQGQAEMLRRELKRIESRIREIEGEQPKNE
jgi:prefoldin subunit 5